MKKLLLVVTVLFIFFGGNCFAQNVGIKDDIDFSLTGGIGTFDLASGGYLFLAVEQSFKNKSIIIRTQFRGFSDTYIIDGVTYTLDEESPVFDSPRVFLAGGYRQYLSNNCTGAYLQGLLSYGLGREDLLFPSAPEVDLPITTEGLILGVGLKYVFGKWFVLDFSIDLPVALSLPFELSIYDQIMPFSQLAIGFQI